MSPCTSEPAEAEDSSTGKARKSNIKEAVDRPDSKWEGVTMLRKDSPRAREKAEGEAKGSLPRAKAEEEATSPLPRRKTEGEVTGPLPRSRPAPGGRLQGKAVSGCPGTVVRGSAGTGEADGAGEADAADAAVEAQAAGPMERQATLTVGEPAGGGAAAPKRRGEGTPEAPEAAQGNGRTGIQPPIDLYVTESRHDKIANIFPGDARRMLRHMESFSGGIPKAALIFDNDLDGFSSAVFMHRLLWDMGIEIAEDNLIPMTHLDLISFRHEPDVLYFYVDIQPLDWGSRVFCVDHHVFEGKTRHLTEQAMIYAPEDIERHFPTTALMVVMYLDYVYRGGNLDFISFVMERLWDRNDFTRRMVLLDSVSDNLWMLSRHSKVRLLRTWIAGTGLDETELIKVSIAASLIIGELKGNIKGLERFFDTPFEQLKVSDIHDCFNRVRSEVDNLFSFATELHAVSDQVVIRRNSELDGELQSCLRRLELDNESLDQLIESMPVHVKRDKETLLDMLSTVGDKTHPRWKQVEFYATEVPRMTKVIEGNKRRLEMLREKKRMVFPEVINGICVFIAHQRSSQVKGILSSLIYYLGSRNLIIEEGEHASVWGARGFSRDFLESELTTLQVDRHALGLQTNMDHLADQVPHSFKQVLNITKNITIQRQYMGGMGGRGLIFGGNINGRVPKIFATLDDELMQRKVAELVARGELAKAVYGITEGQDLVSTAQALRSKFKARGWITFQAIGTGGSGDILTGDVGSPLVWLAGKGTQITLNGNGARLNV